MLPSQVKELKVRLDNLVANNQLLLFINYKTKKNIGIMNNHNRHRILVILIIRFRTEN